MWNILISEIRQFKREKLSFTSPLCSWEIGCCGCCPQWNCGFLWSKHLLCHRESRLYSPVRNEATTLPYLRGESLLRKRLLLIWQLILNLIPSSFDQCFLKQALLNINNGGFRRPTSSQITTCALTEVPWGIFWTIEIVRYGLPTMFLPQLPPIPTVTWEHFCSYNEEIGWGKL